MLYLAILIGSVQGALQTQEEIVMKISFILSLVIFGFISNVNATNLGGESYLGGGVREEVSPCHAYVIDEWFTGFGPKIIDGRGILAQRDNAGEFGFTVDDLLYISIMSILDDGLAYKEALRICGLYGK